MIAEMGRKERVAEVMHGMELHLLNADDPAVERMVTEYRARYGLGPRDRPNEKATAWWGTSYGGDIVAITGDRLLGNVLEITDAYYDGTREGKVAFVSMLYGYRQRLQQGDFEKLIHSTLYANTNHWQAIVRETGDAPYMLTFIHERKS